MLDHLGIQARDPSRGVRHDHPGRHEAVRALTVAIALRSSFVYFVQPMIGGICLAAAFFASVIMDRPLARRFANDFLPLPRRLLHDGRVHRFFRHVSLMWGVVGLANAGLGLWLLTTLSTNAFVVASTLLGIVVTGGAVAASVVWFRRTIARVPATCAV